MNYICVYAICKNESKNVGKWYMPLQDADLVIINDTGSTDNTVDLFTNLADDYDNIRLIESKYEKFDFSVARNDCLNYAKKVIRDEFEDTDREDWVFVSLDLDETLNQSGIAMIRLQWNSQYDTMSLIGNTGNGSSMRVDYKVHNWFFYWYRSVHEIITRDGLKESDWKILNSDIEYIHEQDLTKERNYYELLKLDHEKRPNDVKTLTYLCWEACLHNEYDEVYKYAIEALGKIVDPNNARDNYWNDPQYKSQLHIYLAIYYRVNHDYIKEIEEYDRVEEMIHSGEMFDFRNLHYMYAEALWNAKLKLESGREYEKILKISNIPDCWIDKPDLYVDDNRWILKACVALYYGEAYYDSLYYAMKLYRENPEVELYKSNLDSIKAGFENYIKSN